MKLHYFALLAVALVAPVSGVISPAYAEPKPVERKFTPVSFIFNQIVGLDIAARTVDVRTPKTIELLGKPAINIGEFETVTVRLSPKVELKEMHNEAHCNCSFAIGLEQVAKALKEKRTIAVGMGTNDKDEAEVTGLTVFTRPQKPIEEAMKEHFRIERVPQK